MVLLTPLVSGFRLEASRETETERVARGASATPVPQPVLRGGVGHPLPVLARCASDADCHELLAALLDGITEAASAHPASARAPSEIAPSPGMLRGAPAASFKQGPSFHLTHRQAVVGLAVAVAIVAVGAIGLGAWVSPGGRVTPSASSLTATGGAATGTSKGSAPKDDFDFDAAVRQGLPQTYSSAAEQPTAVAKSLTDTLRLSPARVGTGADFNWQNGPLPAAQAPARTALTPAPYAAVVAAVAPTTADTRQVATDRGLSGSMDAIGLWSVPDAVPMPDHVTADPVVNPGDFLIQAMTAPSLSRAEIARALPTMPDKDARASSRIGGGLPNTPVPIPPQLGPAPALPPGAAPMGLSPAQGPTSGADAFIEAAKPSH